ncbi:hypothetical protein D9M71_418690 [compost metagenome]
MLQGLEPADRQQQGLAGIARRIEVEAPAVDQFGHGQQFFGFVGLQAAVAPPSAEKNRQCLGFDTEELDIDLVDVQRNHRQAFGQACRQQRAMTGKTDARLQITGFQAA